MIIWILEVWLSCYLVLLKTDSYYNDNKTAALPCPDIYTHRYSYNIKCEMILNTIMEWLRKTQTDSEHTNYIPYLTLMGELQGVHPEFFAQYCPSHNRSALYLEGILAKRWPGDCLIGTGGCQTISGVPLHNKSLLIVIAQIAPLSFQASIQHKPRQVRWDELNASVATEWSPASNPQEAITQATKENLKWMTFTT